MDINSLYCSYEECKKRAKAWKLNFHYDEKRQLCSLFASKKKSYPKTIDIFDKQGYVKDEYWSHDGHGNYSFIGRDGYVDESKGQMKYGKQSGGGG